MCRVHAERTVTKVGGLFLGKDLISVENGQVVFGRAVADLAEALNPLGAAARIVAESCACITEMRRLNLKGRQLEAAKAERLADLQDRRVVVTTSLHEMHTRVGQAELNARGLRLSVDNMQRMLMEPNISVDHRQACLEALRICTAQLVNQHSTHGDELVRTIDSVLNGSAPKAAGRKAAARGGRNRRTRR